MEQRKLGWVEFGRGIAALAVFVSHGYLVDFPDYLSFTAKWGRWGVAFFFILSGFIIFHVHAKDLGNSDRAANFAWRRLLRIFPTYWVILAVAIFSRQVLGNPDYREHLDLSVLVSHIFILPYSDVFLPVSWTLRHEIFFYALFFVAIVHLRLGLLLFAAWFATIFACNFESAACELLTIGDHRCAIINSPLSYWSPITRYLNMYFFVGMGIAAGFRFGGFKILLASTTAMAATLFAIDLAFNSVAAMVAAQFLACSALVCWAVFLSTKLRAPQLAFWFGAISYPLYLFHLAAIHMGQGIVKRIGTFHLPAWEAKFLVAVIISFAFSGLLVAALDRLLRHVQSSPRQVVTLLR